MTTHEDSMRGALVLLGSDELVDDPLVVARPSGTDEVVVLPTAAAYEHPQAAFDRVERKLREAGLRAVAVQVFGRKDAEMVEHAEVVAAAHTIYLCDGSPLHLRAVMKDSAVLHALVAAWHGGATIIGASAGATVLSDPMVDPRGGAFTVGFGLVRNLAVVAGYDGTLTAQLRRTLSLAPVGCPVVVLGDGAALVRASDGTWFRKGEGIAELYLDERVVDLEVLAGKPVG